MFATLEAERAVKELPFTTEARGTIDFWTGMEASGNTDADIALGEQCAGMCLALARRFDMPVLPAMVLRDMVLSGRFTAVEAGFIASIANAARGGVFTDGK